jgi:hypothetical protein
VCDNFCGSAVVALSSPLQDGFLLMAEELEQEYVALKDKVRDLREYL